jgi:hypothetical protein
MQAWFVLPPGSIGAFKAKHFDTGKIGFFEGESHFTL